MKPKIGQNATELENIAAEISDLESTTTQPRFEMRVEPKTKQKMGQNDTFENLAREEISDFENEPSVEKRVEPEIKEELGQNDNDFRPENEINTATKNDTFENLAREEISGFENEQSVEKRVKNDFRPENKISTATKNDTFENLAREEISEKRVEPKIKDKLRQKDNDFRPENEINTATKKLNLTKIVNQTYTSDNIDSSNYTIHLDNNKNDYEINDFERWVILEQENLARKEISDFESTTTQASFGQNDTFENLAREEDSDFENEPSFEKRPENEINTATKELNLTKIVNQTDTSDTSDLNQVDLPKFTTKNFDKEANNETYITVTIITFALLLFLLMIIILLTLFCKKSKKKESFPLQELGESE